MNVQDLLSTPEIRKEAAELRILKPVWNIKLAGFFVVWAATAYMVVTMNTWYVSLIGYPLMGILLHGIGASTHESVHNLLSKNRVINNILGFVSGLPLLLSKEAFKVIHLKHHKYTREKDDPDNVLNVTSNKKLLSVIFYAWMLIGGPIYILTAPFTALKLTKSVKQRLQIIGEYLIIWTMLLVCISVLQDMGKINILFDVWLIPALLGSLLVNIRGISEHSMIKATNALTKSRTVLSNKVISFLYFNGNYHLEHHLLPNVPWYNLPKAHALFKDELYKNGAHITPSYTKVILDSFRLGIHGVEAT